MMMMLSFGLEPPIHRSDDMQQNGDRKTCFWPIKEHEHAHVELPVNSFIYLFTYLLWQADFRALILGSNFFELEYSIEYSNIRRSPSAC